MRLKSAAIAAAVCAGAWTFVAVSFPDGPLQAMRAAFAALTAAAVGWAMLARRRAADPATIAGIDTLVCSRW